MTDMEQIRAMDCRDVARRLLGQPVRSARNYDVYASPLRDDGKTPSFTVYEGGFKDYGGDGASGDVIELVKRVNNLDFKEAVRFLGGDVELRTVVTHRPRPDMRPREAEAPPADWQSAAWDVIVQAQRTLWSPVGERALTYLRDARGLSDQVIREAQLGYVPGAPKAWANISALKVPCGILIPWVIDGEVWSLKVRRAAYHPKYVQVAGGSSGGLYLVDKTLHWQVVLIVEGEFDALVVKDATNLVAPVALGSASNTLNERWMGHMIRAFRIFARLDDDQAGEKGLKRLRSISERVKGVRVPDPHKDINDYWLADPGACTGWLHDLAKF